MKTAMQLLLEKFDRMPEYLFATYLKVNRDGLLEKEKEQIIEANRQGRCNDCPIMYSNQEAQEYYNQTYKPETI